MNATDWALAVIADIKTILTNCPDHIPIGIEGVTEPKGFNRGQRAPINPAGIIKAGIVLGAMVATWPNAPIIPPGGNGSQHYSHYPAALIGRRPKDLPGVSNGAGTRDHEQSAYDIAGKTARIVYPTGRGIVKFGR